MMISATMPTLIRSLSSILLIPNAVPTVGPAHGKTIPIAVAGTMIVMATVLKFTVSATGTITAVIRAEAATPDMKFVEMEVARPVT